VVRVRGGIPADPTPAEQSVCRNTRDHFDAIKIGLTATPAPHTLAYFENKVFDYPYTRAVREGDLVDYDIVKVKSDVRLPIGDNPSLCPRRETVPRPPAGGA
jgi:hypothetical protein